MTNHRPLILLLLLLVTVITPQTAVAEQPTATQHQCTPTPEDEMGPFYRPGAPLRSKIGSGYLLTGTVKSAEDCSAIPAPLIEFWQAGPNGRYDDAHRAAIITDHSGEYRFETDFPGDYFTRPAHIHIRVTSAGFHPLTTQHYLRQGSVHAVFDLVLIPE